MARLIRRSERLREKRKRESEEREREKMRVLQIREEQIRKSMAPVVDINSLPEEILLEIFKYLTQIELIRISRVNKRWNESVKSPVLWKKVTAKICYFRQTINAENSGFTKRFSPSITYMKIDFWRNYTKTILNFCQLCKKLKERCPHLHTLILYNAVISVNIFSLISLCSELLPNLSALIVNSCEINTAGCRLTDYSSDSDDSNYSEIEYNHSEIEYSGHAKIEILDLSNCTGIPSSIMHSISKMPCLKKLSLASMPVTCTWFMYKDCASFLHQLKCLHLGHTSISLNIISILKKYAQNLTELYLCKTELQSDIFNGSKLPLLKTICINSAYVNGQGIISIIEAIPSLENVYVDEAMARSYAEQFSLTANAFKFETVKIIRCCQIHKKLEFLLD